MAIDKTKMVEPLAEESNCTNQREGSYVSESGNTSVYYPRSSGVVETFAVHGATPSGDERNHFDQNQAQSANHGTGTKSVSKRARKKSETRIVNNRRKGATLRSDGRWQAVAYLGKTANGKPFRRTFYGKTKSEALHKVELARSAYLTGVITLDDRRTFREWAESWLINSAPLNCKASTVTWYRDMLTRHAIPILGNLRLQQIRPLHIDNVMASLESQGKATGTQRGVRSAINVVLAGAERNELIQSNPVRKTQPPKVKDASKVRNPEPFKEEQIPDLVRLMNEDPRGIIYLFLLATGMRRGEALAITWKDFGESDEGFSVRISKQLQELRIIAPDGGTTVERTLSTPKTTSGYRDVPITKELWENLKNHRNKQRSQGFGWNDEEPIFQSKVGTPYWPSNVTSAWTRFLKRAGLKHTQLHGLRHTFATLSLKNGAPLESVTQTLGHSRLEITKNLYARRIPGASRKTVDAFNPIRMMTTDDHLGEGAVNH
jgi:integrase